MRSNDLTPASCVGRIVSFLKEGLSVDDLITQLERRTRMLSSRDWKLFNHTYAIKGPIDGGDFSNNAVAVDLSVKPTVKTEIPSGVITQC